MGIFDNIKASVSSTVRQASEDARVYADKNRVKKEIMSLEAELANCYRDLGNLVYREHQNDPDYPYQDLFQTITQVQASLTERQNALNRLLGIQSCPNCGTPIPLNVRFCSNCGAKAPELPSPAAPQAVCRGCGQPLDPEAMFCSNCGQSVEAEKQAASPFSKPDAVPVTPAIPMQPAAEEPVKPDAPADAPDSAEHETDVPEIKQDTPAAPVPEAPAETPEQPAALVCPNCGEPIASDALFCACCGNKVPGLD
ncbi:MAG: zinc ribbon domain-containing protein [Oscillospiraceae bacterium]|nr:zinc ribbon domain-containing protein [Oscillospiraceae bacterium]